MKISTIPLLCPDPGMQPRSAVAAFLLGAALADNVLDHDRWERSLLTSTGLALIHVGILRSGIWQWPCCRRV